MKSVEAVLIFHPSDDSTRKTALLYQDRKAIERQRVLAVFKGGCNNLQLRLWRNRPAVSESRTMDRPSSVHVESLLPNRATVNDGVLVRHFRWSGGHAVTGN